MNLSVVVYANNLWSSFCSFRQKRMIFIVPFFSKDSGEIYIIKKFEICESIWEKQTSKNVLLNKRIIELKATICLYAVYIIKIQHQFCTKVYFTKIAWCKRTRIFFRICTNFHELCHLSVQFQPRPLGTKILSWRGLCIVINKCINYRLLYSFAFCNIQRQSNNLGFLKK